MPHVRITDLLHDVVKQTGFLSGFTNLPTLETHDNEGALLATILADGSNLGLAQMAEASQDATPDQLVWTQSAYMREDTYKAALLKSSMRTMRCRLPPSGARELRHLSTVNFSVPPNAAAPPASSMRAMALTPASRSKPLKLSEELQAA